ELQSQQQASGQLADLRAKIATSENELKRLTEASKQAEKNLAAAIKDVETRAQQGPQTEKRREAARAELTRLDQSVKQARESETTVNTSVQDAQTKLAHHQQQMAKL